MFRETAAASESPLRSGGLRRFFDIWSRFYDAKAPQSLTYGPVHDEVCAEIAHQPVPERIVDVGCGTGILAVRLADAYPAARVTGVDLSPGMLERARRRSDSVTWVEADAQHLPFEDASFDSICCTESFHWYPDQLAALSEFRRILGRAGVLYLAFINPSTHALERTVNSLTQAVGRPAHWMTGPGLELLLGDAGFEVRRRVRVRRWPPAIALPTWLTVAVPAGVRDAAPTS